MDYEWDIQAAEQRARYNSDSGFVWLAKYAASFPQWIDELTVDEPIVIVRDPDEAER